ncbi:hypothetical protein HMPREF9332_00387 [Alloprevotella rava F0323]|uniref:DUF4153 domain-containing protein n=1 Tax=Alloprevotella rava F0323 TaxID=679199 RepID=G5G9Y6_9BACT|nr:DUF4153 domain-containing protein [Alloprevotella rava]EHG24186.1 hypothetical protein HMPREF9332_00387 [Alloprevotella rava F0323]
MFKFINKYLDMLSGESLLRLWHRFWLPLLEVCVLAVLLLCGIHIENLDAQRWWQVAVYFLSSGAILSLSLQMWGEEVRRKWLRWTVFGVLQALWVVNAIYLYYVSDFSIEHFVSNLSLVTSFGLSVLVCSFFRSKNDLPYWNFSLYTLATAIVSIIIGGVLQGGVSLLYWMLDILFNIDVSWKVYIDTSIITALLLSVFLFLLQQPYGEKKHNYTLHSVQILNIFARFLLAPLLMVYAVVLYVYAARILVAWTLPIGWVSVPVSILVVGVILLIILLYPARMQETPNKFDKLCCRWMPLLILPLLILMTVGIAKRLNDYGITYMRLYLLLFNFWCYGICVYLIFTRSLKIKAILLSFSILFVLSSVGPWNFVNVTQRVLANQVRGIIENSVKKPKLPMDDETFDTYVKTLPYEQHSILMNKLSYLHYNIGSSAVKEFITKDVTLWDKEVADTLSLNYVFQVEDDVFTIPAGVERIAAFDVYSSDIADSVRTTDIMVVSSVVEEAGKEHEYFVSFRLSDIKKWSKLQTPVKPLIVPTRDKNVDLLITNFSFYSGSNKLDTEDKNLSVHGYLLFYKNKGKNE